MKIESVRQRWSKGQWVITAHALKRMGLRRITMDEITKVILEGEIIEDYPDDKPFPSCLIMGYIRDGFPLYVVVALGKKVYVITAHWLDPSKWLDPKTRREKEP